MSPETKAHIVGVAILGSLLAAAIGLWLWLKPKELESETARLTLFDQPVDVGFRKDSKTPEILAVAADAAEELSVAYPDSPEVLSAQARMHMLIGENEAAQAAWEKACEIRPNFPEALYGLGLTAFENDEYEKALAYYQDTALVGPNDPRLPVAIADCLLRLGEAEQAKLVLQQHVSDEQSTVEAWLQLGQANLQLKEFDNAIACYQRVLQFDSDARDAVYGLMRAQTGAGRKEEAARLNSKFRELAQRDREANAAKANSFSDYAYAASVASQVYWDAFRIHRAEGNLDKAEVSLRKAVATAPESLEYVQALRKFYREADRLPEATDAARRAVELAPQSAEELCMLGALLSEIGRYDESIEVFRKALSSDPDSELSGRINNALSQMSPP